jgi:hypothetical protein
MAHFAKLDENNVVLAVFVVSNDIARDEISGTKFLIELTGHKNWKQTSYNSSYRGCYAGVGYTYDVKLNLFIPPQPYPSWRFDDELKDWISPTPQPSQDAMWEEKTKSWAKGV